MALRVIHRPANLFGLRDRTLSVAEVGEVQISIAIDSLAIID